MTQGKDSADKATKRIRWTARIWSGIIVAYALLLVVGYSVNYITTGEADPYAVDDIPITEQLTPIFIFLAIFSLVIAWFKEKIGGILNLIFVALAIPFLYVHWPIHEDPRFIMPYIVVMVVAIPGLLFLLCWKRTEKLEISEQPSIEITGS